jgi:hypothetical protein
MAANNPNNVSLFNADYKFELKYIKKPYDILMIMQKDLGIINFCYAFELLTIPEDCKIFNIGMSTGMDSRLYRKLLYIPGFGIDKSRTTNGKDMEDIVIPAVKAMHDNIYVHRTDIVAHVWDTTKMERTKFASSPTAETEKKLVRDFIDTYKRLPFGNIQNPCKRNLGGPDKEHFDSLFDEVA